MTQHKNTYRVIVHTPEPGAGAGQYVAELVKALAATGLSTLLFCPGNFAYKEEVEESGVTIIKAPAREVGRASLWRRIIRNIGFAARGARTFWAVVDKGDIVHFQFAPHLGLGLLYFVVARLKNASVVLTAHDPVPHRWILPRPFRFIEMGLLSIGYRFCSRVIVHNQTGRQSLLRDFHLDSRLVTVVPHGPLNPISTGIPDDGPAAHEQPLRLLAFGSLRENKGLHLSIAAVQRLQKATTDRPVVVTIAGSVVILAERAYWTRCLLLIERQPSGIEVVERMIDDAEIGALFASHDAVLLPYTGFQSESGVAMLALSHRRPILATSAGGLGELLGEVDCGVLIDSATVDAVAAAMKQAASLSPDLLRNRGIEGYAHVLTQRSWKRIAELTREVYDALSLIHSSAPREKRVVLHTPEASSSAGLYVDALSSALTAQGIPLRVVCPANHQARGVMEANPLLDVHVCCERATNTNISLALKVAQNVQFVFSSSKTLLAATNPGDVVHFQYMLHLPFGLIFFLCAWLRGAHIVFTVHDPVPHKFLFPGALRSIEMRALRLAYYWSDMLMVHSEAGKRKLVEAFGVKADKIRVVPHGPYELKDKVGPCVERDQFEVLFFGSLRENKGLHLAIGAVQQLAGQGVRIRLTIAGRVLNRKEQDYWQQCRTLIDSSSSAIRLIETFVPDQELANLFSECHCFVLPYTTYSSDSGVAYMALANAKPILATDAGGLGWLLENSGGGVRIPEASVEGVTAGLRLAMAIGPDRLERMGHTGAQWVLAECGWPRVASDTRDAYAEFLPHLNDSKVQRDNRKSTNEMVGVAYE